MTKRMTKRQRRQISLEGSNPFTDNVHVLVNTQPKQAKPFQIKQVVPLTDNQRTVFGAYEDGQNLLLTGLAGTGKTFLSLYLSLQEVTSGFSDYKKVIIVRSIVPSRDMGFLPGSPKDKAKVYETPYQGICSELFKRGDAYDLLKSKNMVEFVTTSFVRGITMSDAIIIVDEFQNMDSSELHTIITRVGKNCKIIFSGDIKQTDLNSPRDKSGFGDFVKVLNRMKNFEWVDFKREDILRSDLVKQYIIARDDLEEKGIVAPINRG